MSIFRIVCIAVCTIFNSAYAGSNLKIAVIGAGPSGLAAAKLSIDKKYEVTVYEQNEALGGTWWYTDEVGINSYGIKVHTAAYEGLRAQTHRDSMGYPDFEYPKSINPYPPYADVWRYLDSYANKFDLKKHIKLLHQVTNVTLIENEKWKVTVKDLTKNESKSDTFDAVFVCNGLNFDPNLPKLKGSDKFKGKILHSHDYRRASHYKGKRVVVIGGGPSGLGIVKLLSRTTETKSLTWVKHSAQNRSKEDNHLPNVVYKEALKTLTEGGVNYSDGTSQSLDVVICATGYRYSYPFLDASAGITVKDNHIQPLYKQVFNVQHPTLIFIAIPASLPSLPLYHFQVAVALAILSGEKKLPSKEAMEAERLATVEKHLRFDSNKRHMHRVPRGEYKDYIDGLSELGGVEPPKKSLFDLFYDNIEASQIYPFTYKKNRYTVTDGKCFRESPCLSFLNI